MSERTLLRLRWWLGMSGIGGIVGMVWMANFTDLGSLTWWMIAGWAGVGMLLVSALGAGFILIGESPEPAVRGCRCRCRCREGE